jgi:hypothetical protein
MPDAPREGGGVVLSQQPFPACARRRLVLHVLLPRILLRRHGCGPLAWPSAIYTLCDIYCLMHSTPMDTFQLVYRPAWCYAALHQACSAAVAWSFAIDTCNTYHHMHSTTTECIRLFHLRFSCISDFALHVQAPRPAAPAPVPTPPLQVSAIYKHTQCHTHTRARAHTHTQRSRIKIKAYNNFCAQARTARSEIQTPPPPPRPLEGEAAR